MPDYKEMYFQLAAKVANAVDILVEAQQQGEYDYIEEKTLVISLKNSGPEKQGSDQAGWLFSEQDWSLYKIKHDLHPSKWNDPKKLDKNMVQIFLR